MVTLQATVLSVSPMRGPLRISGSSSWLDRCRYWLSSRSSGCRELQDRRCMCWHCKRERRWRPWLPFSFSNCEWKRAVGSDRLDGNRQHIINQPDFLLHERLGVSHAAEHSVIPCHRFHARANVSLSGEDSAACLLIAELGL